jgi:hypothetical protein
VIKRRDGSEEVVVAGGVCEGWLDTVEIFSLEESQWRSGKIQLYCIKHNTVLLNLTTRVPLCNVRPQVSLLIIQTTFRYVLHLTYTLSRIFAFGRQQRCQQPKALKALFDPTRTSTTPALYKMPNTYDTFNNHGT